MPKQASDARASKSFGWSFLCCLCSLLFNFLAAISTGQAQGAIEAWVQGYDGPGNGGDSAADVAVDASGNIYVTGRSYGGDPLYGGSGDDSATIKYSSAGVPAWTNSYSGPGSGQEYTRAVAVDNSGNVFVTGVATDVNGEAHCATLKYSSAGMPLWTNVYTAPGSLGVALVVDPSGNVVVMSSLWQAGNGDYLTLKYSSAGVLLWARQYNGPGDGHDMANAVAVDGNGNVFVTGASPGIGGFNDYATVKYSSAGAQLWVRRYNGCDFRNEDDQGKAVAVDANGDVYVTGISSSGYDNFDYATLKYSSTGVPLWTNRYNGPANRGDSGRAIAVGPSGDVYVSGWASGVFFATIKYSSPGVPLWTNLYDGPISGAGDGCAMAVDSAGNAYITGYSEGIGSDFDSVTIAYSSSGVPLWTNRYNGPANGRDGANAVAVDANGNVYVAGYSAGSGSGDDWARADWVTVKYVTPPIITRQPVSRTNALGTTANFTVEAAGGLPLSYQWRMEGTNLVDGGNISGVTTTNLLVAEVQLADQAGYAVVVTNAYGSVTSTVAQLTVIVPPNPGRFSSLSYAPETGLSFIFRDGTVGKSYRIQVSPSLAGGWVDWTSFHYSAPRLFTDMEAVGTSNRFYRAVSP